MGNNATRMSRKSTPKYQVETQEGVVVFGPASKTACGIASRGMNRKGKPPVVRIVKAAAYEAKHGKKVDAQ